MKKDVRNTDAEKILQLEEAMKIQRIFIKIMLPMLLTVCLSAVAILYVTGRLFDSAYETQIMNQNSDSCSFIAQSVESFMSRAYSITEELANSEAILTMEHDVQTPIVEGTAARNDYFELIYIQDMNGDQTARSSGELGNRANRWWFTLMLEKEQPFVSKSYYSVNTNMTCASIFFPLMRNAEMIGIFATDIKLVTLQSLVEQFSDVEMGKISYIIDGEGNVVAHPESIYYEELYNYKTLTKTVTKKDETGETVYDADGNIVTEELPIQISDEYADVIDSVMAGKTGSAQITDNGVTYFADYAPVRLQGSSDSWAVVTLQDKAKAMEVMNRMNRTGILITVLAVLLALLIIFGIAHTITKPIKLSHKRLQQLSEGDLTTVVPNVKGKDESAQLLKDLNETIEVLRDIVGQINTSVKNIAEGDFKQTISSKVKGEFETLVSSLNTIVGSMGSTLYQINTYANQFLDGLSTFDEAARSLADGTMSQAGAVEQLSSTMNGISDNVVENAKNSRDADRMMTSVREQLQECDEDLNHLISAMEAIENDAEEISSITKLMQDIASKTHLLSMNASVEAARAGKAGESFAVVALEIRNLANQCGDANVETTELIEKTRNNVRAGMESLKATVSSIQSVSAQNNSAGQLISDISAATSEQSDAIIQINTTLQQISTTTQSNSETASESAHTSARMKQQAEELKRLLQSYQY